MGPEDYEDSSLEAQVIEAPDGVSGSSVVSSEEDQRYAKTMNARSRHEHSPFRFNKRAFLMTTGSVIGIFLVVLASVWIFGKQSNSPSANLQSDYASQKVDTQTVGGYDELLDKAPSLQVNGQLQVSEGVTLQPSSAPANPEEGQLYYNANTNEPYYYNGTKFVSFAPTEIPPHVSSLGGATGSIAVGNGLQVTTNGQLSLTAAVLNSLQSLGAINTNGTVPWKNLTDYPAACGSGQAITKLADNPTCTAFLSSAAANSRFIQLQNTTPGTAQAGNLNISGRAIAGSFSGNGASLTGLNASNLSSGTIASGRVSGNYSGISGVGTLTVGTWNANTIAVDYGGTGQTSFTANGVLVGNGTNGLNVTAAGTTGDCLVGNTGAAPTWQDCSAVSGGGVSSLNTLEGGLTIQGTPGQIAISDNGSDTLTVTLDASVSLLGQTISLSELAASSVDSSKIVDGSIANVDIGNNAVALGSQTTGNYQGFTTAGDGVTVTGAAGEGTSPTVAVDNTVCRTTGNCTGVSGGAIGGGGTLNTIAMFTPDGYNIGNSILTQSGTTITAAGTLAADFVQGDGSGLTSVDAVTLQGNAASYFTNASNLSSGTVASGRLTGSYTGITGVGTITAGTWNATVLTDTYVSNTLTIDGTGTVNWQALSSYPAACSAGEAITALADSPTCSAFLTGSAADGAYVQLQSTTPGSAQTGNLNISGAAIAGSFSGNGAALTNLNASNIASGILNDGRLSANVSLLGATVALGTETTGSYQAFTTAGDGISVTGAAGVGTSPTVGVDGTVCRTTGNCAGAGNGGGATNSGSQNYLTKTDGSGNLIGSLLYDDGTKIGLGTNTPGYLFDVQGGAGIVGQFSGRVIGADAVNGDEFVTKDQLDAAAGSAAGSGITSLNTLEGDVIIQGTAGQVGITDNGSDTLTVALDANVSLLGQTIDSSEIVNGTIQNADLQAGAFGNITGVGTLTTGTWNASTIAVNYGGTGQNSFTANGVLFGNGTSGLGTTAAGVTGDCLVANTGAAPTWQDCLAASGGSGVTSLNTLDGGLTLQGTAGKVSITDNGSNTITLDLDASVSLLGQSIASSEITDSTIQNVDLQAGTFGNITGVGILGAGSINWSGNVATSGTVSGTTVNGTTINQNGNQVCDTSNNCGYTGSGSGAGVGSLNGLSGDLTIQGNSQIAVNALSPNISLSIQANSIGDAQLQYDTGQNLTTTSTPTFDGLLIDSGDVGIGTLTPSYRLDVAGTANATSLFQNGFQVCDSSGNCAGAGNGGGITNAGQENFLTKTDPNGNLVSSQIYDDGTKISIGSTSPGYDLQVDGTIQADTLYQGANQVCDTSGNCGYSGDGSGAGVASVNTLTGDLTIQGNSQIQVTQSGGDTIELAIQADTIGNTQLQYDTGQNLTTTSTPTFGGLTLNGTLTATSTVQGTRFISTASTGTAPLTVSSTTVVTNLNSDLLDGQTGSYYQNANNINAGTLGVAQGGTGTGTLTQFGIVYGNGTGAVGVTAAGTTGQCLVATTSAAPTWGSCTPTTLQGAYDASSSPATILLADAKNFVVNAADTATDPSIIMKLSCTSCGTGATGNFQVQNSSNAALLSVAGNGTIQIGTASNGISLSGSGGTTNGAFTLSGTARNSKTIRLVPEYPSVVLDGDLTNNLGTMTSGNDASNRRINYYNWTTTQLTNQDYDIVVQVPIPSDFDGWDGANPLTISTYTTDTTNGTITLEARDSANSVICNYVNVTPGSTTTWTPNNTACTLSSGTYTPGDYMTFRIKLQAPNGGNTRVGNIVLNYKSKF